MPGCLHVQCEVERGGVVNFRKREWFIYLAYAIASIILYRVFHEFLGIGIWRNASAAAVAALVFVPYAHKLRTVNVFLLTLAVQVVGPTLIALLGLNHLIGAPLGDVLLALPEIVINGFVASFFSLVVFVVAKNKWVKDKNG